MLLTTVLFLGCDNKTQNNICEWKLLNTNVSWGNEQKSCTEIKFKLPSKNDFLNKLQKEPSFFDKNTIYAVTPTITDKVFDNQQLGSGQILNKNNDNIYFDPKTKQLVNYSVKLQQDNDFKTEVYCIKCK